MYSIVLMAAMTTATDLPDWGRRGGCCGCYGGYGWGGWGRGYGGYGWGGWGGGYGGWGGGYGGGWGGWGGGYGGWGGGWGGWGYVAAPMYSSYAAPMMLASNRIPATPTVLRSAYYSPTASANNRATIIVRVPENTTLLVDGKVTNSTARTRRFYSPPLEPGKSYHYNFEARVDMDGQTMLADKRVDFRAGDTREITIRVPDLHRAVEREQPTRLPDEDRGLPENRTKLPPK